MRAPSPPGLPLTRVYAGHVVVAISLTALGPTQMTSHPHPLPLDRDPGGRDTPAPLTRLPPRPHHAGATSTRSPLPPRYNASTSAAHLDPAATGAVSTRPPPPPRLSSPLTSFTRPLIGAVSTQHSTHP
ncbi:hypothetical protein EDB84DRAFT_1584641 [Lactarius hengduanensis]|nr:hypothetical protein EDB84DRAFT_1584641 [Lactarius hengduanensis]